jgi:hypothetical protein
MNSRDVQLTAGETQLARLALDLFRTRDAEAAEHIGLEGRTLSLPGVPQLCAQFVMEGIWGISDAIDASSLPSERKAQVRRTLVRLADKVTSAVASG